MVSTWRKRQRNNEQQSNQIWALKKRIRSDCFALSLSMPSFFDALILEFERRWLRATRWIGTTGHRCRRNITEISASLGYFLGPHLSRLGRDKRTCIDATIIINGVTSALLPEISASLGYFLGPHLTRIGRDKRTCIGATITINRYDATSAPLLSSTIFQCRWLTLRFFFTIVTTRTRFNRVWFRWTR